MMKCLAAVLLLAACRSNSTAPVVARAPTPAPAQPTDAPVVARTPTPARAQPTGTAGSAVPADDMQEPAPQHGIFGAAALVDAGAFASVTGAGSGSISAIPTSTLGSAIVKGHYDKNIANRYLQRSQQRLQYCYEKQLLATEGLAGTLTVHFAIGADGRVTTAAATGVHVNVETCVATTLRAIEFPKPPKGEVEVEFPITFAPG